MYPVGEILPAKSGGGMDAASNDWRSNENLTMNTDLAGRILSFLDANHVISLATAGPDGPHATNLFYARDGYTLLWLSNSRSRHSVHIDTHPQVSATIAPDYCDFPEIKGLQICGQARRITHEAELGLAKRALEARYPFLRTAAEGPLQLREAYDSSDFYALEPAQVVLIDNSRGFGFKETLKLSQTSHLR
jgi:uncharacterized protein YhbP (UPF0306 family)